MPKFDVLTINQKHLAKVNVAKSNMSVNQPNNDIILSFQMWRRYITKQLRQTKGLTSLSIEHIFE